MISKRKQVRITNPDKVFWPETGTTKGQMIEYYIKVSPWLLPCLARRLVSAKIPQWCTPQGFYQKNCSDNAPEWVRTFTLAGKKGKETRWVLIDNLPTLVWLANSGVIEFHPGYPASAALSIPIMLYLTWIPWRSMALTKCARLHKQSEVFWKSLNCPVA